MLNEIKNENKERKKGWNSAILFYASVAPLVRSQRGREVGRG